MIEALDQLLVAELEQVVARRAALEGLAVDLAAKVEQQEIPVAGAALDRLEPGEALAQAAELLIDDVLRHLGVRLADLEPSIVAELRPGAHPDLELERERLAVLIGDRGQLDLRIADRADPRVDQRRPVPIRQRVPHRLLTD